VAGENPAVDAAVEHRRPIRDTACIADPCDGTGPAQFISPHGIAVDSRGDLYVGEVAFTAWPNLYLQKPIPDKLCSLQKFEKISVQLRQQGGLS